MDRISAMFGEAGELFFTYDEVHLKRNEFLKKEGSVDTHIYFILSGSLRVYTFLGEEEHTIRFGYQDNIIASLDSFLSGKPSPLIIQAMKASHLLRIRKAAFETYLQEAPGALQRWNLILSQAILDLMEREQDLLLSNPADRYQRVLQRSPRLFQEVPHKYIAAYLKMTPETLSRLKTKV